MRGSDVCSPLKGHSATPVFTFCKFLEVIRKPITRCGHRTRWLSSGSPTRRPGKSGPGRGRGRLESFGRGPEGHFRWPRPRTRPDLSWARADWAPDWPQFRTCNSAFEGVFTRQFVALFSRFGSQFWDARFGGGGPFVGTASPNCFGHCSMFVMRLGGGHFVVW